LIRRLLREEFQAGAAGWFLFGTTPLSLLAACLAPGPFMPFISSAPVFVVLFFYARQGKYGQAFWGVVLWGLLLFSIIAALYTINPHPVTALVHGGSQIAQARAPVTTGGFWNAALILSLRRVADFLQTGVMAVISGGALALALGAVFVGDLALSMGEVLRGGAGWNAAILTVEPWVVARLFGGALETVGLAAVFYMKLERRRIDWRKPGRMIILGLAFFVFDVYLELYLGPTWRMARSAAISH